MESETRDGYGGRGIVGGEVDPIPPSPTFKKTKSLTQGFAL